MRRGRAAVRDRHQRPGPRKRGEVPACVEYHHPERQALSPRRDVRQYAFEKRRQAL